MLCVQDGLSSSSSALVWVWQEEGWRHRGSLASGAGSGPVAGVTNHALAGFRSCESGRPNLTPPSPAFPPHLVRLLALLTTDRQPAHVPRYLTAAWRDLQARRGHYSRLDYILIFSCAAFRRADRNSTHDAGLLSSHGSLFMSLATTAVHVHQACADTTLSRCPIQRLELITSQHTSQESIVIPEGEV